MKKIIRLDLVLNGERRHEVDATEDTWFNDPASGTDDHANDSSHYLDNQSNYDLELEQQRHNLAVFRVNGYKLLN